MESSIAQFLLRQFAFEQLPTNPAEASGRREHDNVLSDRQAQPRKRHSLVHGVFAISVRILSPTSQRSLHNAPIFRLLLKVAVIGTHQCDSSNFCGNLGSQPLWTCTQARSLANFRAMDVASWPYLLKSTACYNDLLARSWA